METFFHLGPFWVHVLKLTILVTLCYNFNWIVDCLIDQKMKFYKILKSIAQYGNDFLKGGKMFVKEICSQKIIYVYKKIKSFLSKFFSSFE